MNKLFRFYNQNRLSVWIAVIIIVFVILIINTLNGIYKDNDNAKINETNVVDSDGKDYAKQSRSIISEGGVPETHKENFGELVDNFLTYCKNHEPEKAYGLLSQDCKDVLYPNLEIFKEQYYKPKFSTEKIYNFQSWTSIETYVYLVKIYPNMLSTGKGTAQNYIQDYISVVMENDTYLLNINGLVKKVRRNDKSSVDGISITVNNSEIYMDYEIANITVKNNCPSKIMLDTRTQTDSTYVENNNGIKYEAMLFENDEEDLQIESGEEKEIKIKFSIPYQEKNNTVRYVFSDVYPTLPEPGDYGDFASGSRNIKIDV